MKAVYLHPKSSFSTKLRSDTLWGLLINAIGKVYSEATIVELINLYVSGTPPFVISSAFPFYYENEERIELLPKPISDGIRTSQLSKEDMDSLKLYKKVSYLPKKTFENIINAKISETQYYLSKEWITIKSNTTEEQILKTTIDRLTSGTAEKNGRGQLHYSNEIFFKNGGLFFLVDGDFEYIEGALRFLSHFGIGGKNSRGKGFFEFSVDDFQLNIPSDFHSFITLSLLAPAEEEVRLIKENKGLCSYNYEVRRGRLGTHFTNSGDYKKSGVFVFSEGSILPKFSSKYPGKLLTVKRINQIDIKFNGYGFCLPIKILEN